MYDALQALVAERDRVCVVASFLPAESAWGKKRLVRVGTEPEDGGPLVFDTTKPLSPEEELRQFRSLPQVPDDDSDWEPEEAALL